MKSEKLLDSLEFLPEKMLEETDRLRHKKTVSWWKPLSIIAACFALVFFALIGFAAMGVAGADNAAMEKAEDMTISSNLLDEDGGILTGTTTDPQVPEQKLVRTVTVNAETEDLDAVLRTMDAKIAELGGYVEIRDVYNGRENSRISTRRAELVIRIPAEQLNTFLGTMYSGVHVVSSNETVENITLSYVATESRLEALEAEEERLLALMEQAQNMDELLQIEKRLTEVRSELEEIASQLRVYNNMVDYATVNLTVSEVKEYTEVEEPETVWERIGAGLKETFRNLGEFFTDLFVLLIVTMPYVLLLGAVVLVILLIFRKRKK